DYVFRIVPTCAPPLLLKQPSVFDEAAMREILTIDDSIAKLRQNFLPLYLTNNLLKRDEKRTVSESEVDELMRRNIKKACSSMRMQILARTFYG
ncbi:unnamed protein product, partial [Onchocerca ochengi]